MAETFASVRVSAPCNRFAEYLGFQGQRITLGLNIILARSFIAQITAAFDLLDRLVKLRAAKLVAHLLAHSLHHSGDALGIVLVDIAHLRRIGERLHSRLLAARHREPRHEPAHFLPAAMRANGLDLLTDPSRQHAGSPPALLASIFVDRHFDYCIRCPREFHEDLIRNSARIQSRPQDHFWSHPQKNLQTGTKSRILLLLSLGAGVTPAAGAGRAAPHLTSVRALDCAGRVGILVSVEMNVAVDHLFRIAGMRRVRIGARRPR